MGYHSFSRQKNATVFNAAISATSRGELVIMANGYDQEGMSVRGNLYQAGRDVITAIARTAWNFDTSLGVHFFDISARLLLAAFAAYRLGYRRGISAGQEMKDRRESDT